jgi:hypothetical protein
MFEPWALDVKFDIPELALDDPDQPIDGVVKKNSSKRERTGHAMIRYVRSKTCLRKSREGHRGGDTSYLVAVRKWYRYCQVAAS